MEISIKQGEGVSQAIKRELMAEGIQESQFTGSIWSKIQKSLQDGASVIQHGEKETKIGELWTSLSQNVKTYINDVLKIVDSTWDNIKNFFTAAPGASTAPSGEIPPAPAVENLPPKPDTSETKSYSEASRQRDIYRNHDESRTEYPYNESLGIADSKYYDYDGKLVCWEESTPNGVKEHYYDTNGKEVQCIEKDDDDNIISITEYDKEGKELQVTTKTKDGWKYDKKSDIEFHYDSKGNCTSITEYENGKKKNVTNFEKGELHSYHKCEHNEDGGYNAIGHSNKTGSDYIMEFDKNGNKVRQIYYKQDGSMSVVSTQANNKYVRYDYDKEGNLKEEYWCDKNGQRIQ